MKPSLTALFLIAKLVAGCTTRAAAILWRTCRRGWAGFLRTPRPDRSRQPMTPGKPSERGSRPPEGRMPLVDAHTVLPLYLGIMIRRSKGRILRGRLWRF
jgi:hypothetical protein